MSAIAVHVGQAGNAIGGCLWDTLHDEATAKPEISHTLFTSYGHARAVFVDTEPKVLNTLIARDRKRHIYHSDSLLCEQSGRGKNWAMGYSVSSDPNNEHSLLSRTMHAIRRQAEACDNLQSCVVFHSVAGGTGSGLGSRLLQSIRGEYPRVTLLSTAIAPFTRGDNPLQHYNTLLSLHCMQQFTDGVMWFHNSEVMSLLTDSKDRSRSIPKEGEKAVDISDMNDVMASQMYTVYAPLIRQGIVRPFDGHVIKTQACPLDQVKMLQIYSSVKGSHDGKGLLNRLKTDRESGAYGWDLIVKDLVKNTPKYANAQQSTLLSSVLIARGRTWRAEQSRHLPTLHKHLSPVTYNTRPVVTLTGAEPAYRTQAIQRSLSLVANRDSVIVPLQYGVNRALEQYRARAYTHWYARYGCDSTCFDEAFETAQGIFDDYRTFTNPHS